MGKVLAAKMFDLDRAGTGILEILGDLRLTERPVKGQEYQCYGNNSCDPDNGACQHFSRNSSCRSDSDG